MISFLVALIVSSAIKIADQWGKAVVLRLGRFHSLRGPGLFFIISIIDTVPYWIDIRVIITSFTAEKTLTKDTVPVDVDAVLFWKVLDAKKAALEIAEYKSAINWASQTALRDDLTIHSARHGYATLLYYKTKDLRAVQKQLGHSSLNMTSLYADIMPEENGEIANKILDN